MNYHDPIVLKACKGVAVTKLGPLLSPNNGYGVDILYNSFFFFFFFFFSWAIPVLYEVVQPGGGFLEKPGIEPATPGLQGE